MDKKETLEEYISRRYIETDRSQFCSFFNDSYNAIFAFEYFGAPEHWTALTLYEYGEYCTKDLYKRLDDQYKLAKEALESVKRKIDEKT